MQIENATSVAQLQVLLGTEEFDFRFDLGISKPVHKIELTDRDTFVSAMALHYGVLVVKAELDQILCGLSATLNALSLIRNNPLVMRRLFIREDRHSPTADTLLDMFQAKFSDLGSNARKAEEATMMKWSDFLQMVEGKVILYNYIGLSHFHCPPRAHKL